MGVAVRIAGRPALFSSAWFALLAILSTIPVLRLGDVQAVEIAQVIGLSAAMPFFVYGGLKVPLGGLWRRYGSRYLLFLGFCVVLSVLSLRLPFYPPPGISLLKRPGLLSLARSFELFLVSYFMIAIAETLRRRPALFRVVADAYTSAATLVACGSIAGWALFRLAGVPSLLLYGADSRVRGSFNEGGPYGIFLVSAVLVVLLRMPVVRPMYPFAHKMAVVILLVALLLSGSKVGLLASISLCAMAAFFSGGTRRKLALAGVLALLVTVFVSRFQGSLFGYFYAYLNFDEAYYYRGEDPNLIMGRIAATMIVPRIVSAHPLLGIGVGNYSLMRNDPAYLQDLPPVVEWDLAGMGLLGSAAEFGIPLTLFLLAILIQPLVHARQRKAPLIVAVAASFQPIAFLLGVNLNFFYPWLVAALVLSLEPARERGGSARGLNQ